MNDVLIIPIVISVLLTLWFAAMKLRKTYTIPVDSFRKQFEAVSDIGIREVTTRGPSGEKDVYTTFIMDYIECVDKKGAWIKLPVSPALEIRFIDLNGKKATFYFDLIVVTGDEVTGSGSRFIAHSKTISLNSTKEIQIQNGGKRFKYVNIDDNWLRPRPNQ